MKEEPDSILPPVGTGNSIPTETAPAARSEVVHTSDGAVYLPEGRKCATDSPEFEQLLKENLPPEIAPDVISQWRGVSGRTTRLQYFTAMLLLIAAAVALILCFPKTRYDELVSLKKLSLTNSFGPLSVNSPYRADHERAVKESRAGRHHQAVRILKGPVEQILRNEDLSSRPVLFCYYDSLRRIRWQDEKNLPDPVSQLKIIRSLDPDTPVWKQFAFELDPKIAEVLDYQMIWGKLQSAAAERQRKELPVSLSEIDCALRDLAVLREQTEMTPSIQQKELLAARLQYDIFEVRLLISRWLLSGQFYGSGWYLPDNFGDNGVEDREKALEIALQNENARCPDFWVARRFIAEILCSQDTLFNHIYWKRKYHKTQNDLNAEIDLCNRRLNPKREN